jgi:hypothetical protein
MISRPPAVKAPTNSETVRICFRFVDGDAYDVEITDVTVSKTLEAELWKAQAALEIRVGEQQADLERSEGRFLAEERRWPDAKQKSALPFRQKKGETP